MIFNPLFIDSETKQINPVGFGKANGSYLFRDIINVVQSSQSQRVFNSSSILNNILSDVRGLTKTPKDGNTKLDDELNLILQELNLNAGFRLSDSTTVAHEDSTTILGSPTRITKILKDALTKLEKEFSLDINLPRSTDVQSKGQKTNLKSLIEHIENLLQEGKSVTLQLNQTNGEESFTLSFNKIKPEVIALSSSDKTKTAYSISIKQETSSDKSNILFANGTSSYIESKSLVEVTTGIQTKVNTKPVDSVIPSGSGQKVHTSDTSKIPIIEEKVLSGKLINDTSVKAEVNPNILVSKAANSTNNNDSESPDNILVAKDNGIQTKLTNLTSGESDSTVGANKSTNTTEELVNNLVDKTTTKQIAPNESNIIEQTKSATPINVKNIHPSAKSEVETHNLIGKQSDLTINHKASNSNPIAAKVDQKIEATNIVKKTSAPEIETVKIITNRTEVNHKASSENGLAKRHVFEADQNRVNKLSNSNASFQESNFPKRFTFVDENENIIKPAVISKNLSHPTESNENPKHLFQNFRSRVTKIKAEANQINPRPAEVNSSEKPSSQMSSTAKVNEITNSTTTQNLTESKITKSETIVVEISAKESKSVEETNKSLRNNFLDDIQKLSEVKRHSFDNIINKLSKTLDSQESILESLRSAKMTDSNSTLASIKNSGTLKILDDVIKTSFNNTTQKPASVESTETIMNNSNHNTGQNNSKSKEQSQSDLKLVHELQSAKTTDEKTEKHINKEEIKPLGEVNKANNDYEKTASKSTQESHDPATNKVNHDFQSQVSTKEVQQNLTNNFNTETVKINTKEQFQPELNAKLLDEISDMVISDKKDKVTLNLDPASLGKIKIAIEIIENKVIARLEVENQSAKEMLQHQVEFLKESLNSNGLQLNSLSISLQNSEAKNGKAAREKKKDNNTEKVDVKEKSEGKNKTKTMGYNTYEFIA